MDWSDWMFLVESFEIDSVPAQWGKDFPAFNNAIKQYLGDTEYIIYLSRYELSVSGRTFSGIADGTNVTHLSNFNRTLEKETERVYLAFKEFYELRYHIKCVNERNSEQMISNVKDKIENVLTRSKDVTASELLKEEVNPILLQRLYDVRGWNPKLNPTVEYTELKKVIHYFKTYKRNPKDGITSLYWQGNLTKREDLYELLDQHKFLNKNTTKYEVFEKVFSGLKLSSFSLQENRIRWTDEVAKDGASETNLQTIYELIFLLIDREYIVKTDLIPISGHKLYKVVSACFLKSDGSEYQIDDIRRPKRMLKILRNSPKAEKLEAIVDSL
jgi:hypothetical protein